MAQPLQISVSSHRDAVEIKQSKVGATFSQVWTELSFEILDIEVILIGQKETGTFIS